MKLHYEDGKSTVLFSIKDIAEELKVNTPTLWHRIYVGKSFPAPTVVIRKRAYYAEAEFLKLTGRKTLPDLTL